MKGQWSKLFAIVVAFVVLAGCVPAPGSPLSPSVDSSPVSPTAVPATAVPPTATLEPAPTDEADASAAPAGAQPGGLRLTTLYDNPMAGSDLKSGWGFAALVEYGGHVVLFDTGADGEALLDNMAKLNIDPKSVEAVVLSHPHEDHTSGLQALLDTGVRPPVYVATTFSESFKKKVGDQTALVEVAEPLTILPGVHTTTVTKGATEQALVLETPDGSVIVTGCAHPGIVEMVRQAETLVPGKVALLAGGFHLLETGDDRVKSIISELRDLGVEEVMATHCTGVRATALFSAAYGDSYLEGGVGRSWDSSQE